MNKYIYIAILAIFCCCKNIREENIASIEPVITNELDRIKLEEKKYLVLFISEGMCSECINREFMNIKQNEWFGQHLIVFGIFSNERYFKSMVNPINTYMNLYVSEDHITDEINRENGPFYVIYDTESLLMSHKMYPDPCDVQKTIEYYETVKKIVGK